MICVIETCRQQARELVMLSHVGYLDALPKPAIRVCLMHSARLTAPVPVHFATVTEPFQVEDLGNNIDDLLEPSF